MNKVTKFFNTPNDITNILRTLMVIWVLCAVYLVATRYDVVAHLAFNDTDDFMRFNQYTDWIKNGNWYLQPIPRFNPDDGLIMHWSRLVDIPLAAAALFMHMFTDWPTAFTLANTIVPLIYLFVFGFVISLVTYKLFSLETARIAILMFLLSPLSFRFIPGSLDHHNLQFILLASFILFLPLTNFDQLPKKAFFSALFMALSLWIGLENIYTFVIILFVMTLLGVFKNKLYLDFCRKFCLNAVILLTICLLLNRPADEFFYAHYDALSFPFLLCFVCAAIFCHLLTYTINKYPAYPLISYALLGIILFMPILLAYPNLITGGYSGYPALLKENWLNNVSEAKSILESASVELKNIGYILAVLPALCSPLLFKNKPDAEKYWILYFAFLINFLLAVFWQIRVFSTALVCSFPLQAYTCLALRGKCGLAITRTLVLFMSFPTVMLILVFAVFPDNTGNNSAKKYEDNKYHSSYVAAVNLLNKNNLHQSQILSTMDLGAAIIASTDNSIIAAPYHRNIRGNSEAMTFFITKDESEAQAILDRNRIDYVIIDDNFFNTLNAGNRRKDSVMSKLVHKKDVPDYLQLVDSTKKIQLYRYIGKNNR